MERNLGLTIIGLGVVAVLVGLLTLTGGLSWFGRLPGDIHFRGERVQFYFPIVSLLVVSVVLTIAVNLLRRLF